jgi:2-aminoethylphosphonate-pyruvate transaminase
LYALKQAIKETKKEGVKNRYNRYVKSWKVLTKFLKKNNLKYLINDKYHSKIITSIFIPKGINFDDMHDYFYKNNFTIYPGKVGGFNTFRVANIGEIDYKDMNNFLKLFKSYLNNILK